MSRRLRINLIETLIRVSADDWLSLDMWICLMTWWAQVRMRRITLILCRSALKWIFYLVERRSICTAITVHLTRWHSAHGMMVVWTAQNQWVRVRLLNCWRYVLRSLGAGLVICHWWLACIVLHHYRLRLITWRLLLLPRGRMILGNAIWAT